MMLIQKEMQEIDLRIGASFTRFQTILLRDAFVLDLTADDRNMILSYGPCQVADSSVCLTNVYAFSGVQFFIQSHLHSGIP